MATIIEINTSARTARTARTARSARSATGRWTLLHAIPMLELEHPVVGLAAYPQFQHMSG